MLKKTLAAFVLLSLLALNSGGAKIGAQPARGDNGFKLGSEVLLESYYHLVKGKKVGLVTNQSGVNSRGESTIEIFQGDRDIDLVALYGPEHGIDGKARAGEYVESYVHPELGIPVYSLYGATRMPTEEMLRGIDVLVFDIQDIGARTYTYISTLNYCMVAAQKYGKPVVVLDRPNPLGGMIVEGPVLEDRFISFVGVDNLPKAHGMTAGELARFFNRKIGTDLHVVPMEGYRRGMVFQDTGLEWVQTSPNIPDLDSVFGYMATGLGEGTGVFQADKFKWVGGRSLDSASMAALLNSADLSGVTFIPEQRGDAGGVRLRITNYYLFNPARSGIYALAHAFSLGQFRVPKSGATAREIVMFDKVMGTDKIGQCLEQGLSPEEIVTKYTPALERFKEERARYLLSDYGPQLAVVAGGSHVYFDVDPFIDGSSRLIVPFRALCEALGAGVDWDPQTREVTIVKGDTRVQFTIDSTAALVNGEEKTMDTRAVIRDGRTMIPLRYAGEYLGARVTWYADKRIAVID